MKTTKRFIAVFWFIVLAAAQQISTNAAVLTWSAYDITFEVPDGGSVTYNSTNHFEVMWQDMALVIDIYSKEGATDEVLKNNLLRRASGYNMFDTTPNKLKVKGFKCHSITGTMPDGSHTLLSNLVCNNKNIVVAVTVNYLLGNIEEAEDIVKSFTIGKQKIKKEKKQKIQSEEDAIAKEKQREKDEKREKEAKTHEIFDI